MGKGGVILYWVHGNLKYILLIKKQTNFGCEDPKLKGKQPRLKFKVLKSLLSEKRKIRYW